MSDLLQSNENTAKAEGRFTAIGAHDKSKNKVRALFNYFINSFIQKS